jgi:hypothetical protein
MIDPSRLLSGRRGLSRPEKEAILDGVLARVAPRPWWRRPAAIGVLAVAAAAATAVLMIRPAPPDPRSGGGDEFTARGGALPASFEVSCVPAPCATGSKLVFDVTSTGGAGYFAAFARRADGDLVIWYFPSAAAARSRPLPAGGGVLDTGIALGAEHPPGRYAIEGVFSSTPLDRPAIRAQVERGAAVVREMIVQ